MRVRANGSSVCAWIAGLGTLGPLAYGCTSIPPGRNAVDAVNVAGGSLVSGADVADKMATAPSPKFLGLWSGVVFDYEVYDPFVLQGDVERVERFYRACGYYDARVRAVRVVERAPRHVVVAVDVDPGPAFTVGELRIDGVSGLVSDVKRAVEDAVHSKLRVGALFDEEDYVAAERAALRALTDRGHAYASVQRRARVSLGERTAAVTIAVDAGPAATFGPVVFVGLDPLPEPPVRRVLNIREGQPYATSALEAGQKALLELGVFSSVDVRPELGDRSVRAVPVTVRAEPTRLRTVRLGGGIELDVIKTDVHLRAGWESRNLWGSLGRFTADFSPGVVLYPTRLPDLQAPTTLLPDEKLRLEHRQPGVLEPRTGGIVRGEFNVYPLLLTPNVSADDPVLGYREFKGAVGLDRTFDRLYAAITYNVQNSTPFAYRGALDPTLTGVLIAHVDLFAHFDLRDDPIHPRRGLYLASDLQLAGAGFSDARDVKVQPEVRGYVPIGRWVTFAVRGAVGFLVPFNYDDSVQQAAARGAVPTAAERPSWNRSAQLVYFRGLFSGGPSSNRGYPYRGVGAYGIVPFFHPSLASGSIAPECDRTSPRYNPGASCAVPLGGFSLWEASTELRFSTLTPLSSALFCDASDVSPQRWSLRLAYPHLSCGVGLRYDTPVGPVRLDLAYRVPGVQVVGATGENQGNIPEIFGLPLAIAFAIGEAF